jgi:hypothetical protein
MLTLVLDMESDGANESDPAERDYRKRLSDSIERMETEYDKALLTLNPAAITVSLALYNQLLTASKVPHCVTLLHIAWLCWIVATLCTLASFLLSKKAMEHALDRHCEGILNGSNYKSVLNECTVYLNWSAGIGFLFGVIFAAIFFK